MALPTSNYVYHRATGDAFDGIQMNGLLPRSGPDKVTPYKFLSVATQKGNTATLKMVMSDWHFRLKVSDMVDGDWVEMANKSEWRGKNAVAPELLEYRSVRPLKSGLHAAWQKLKAGVPATVPAAASSSSSSAPKEEKKSKD